MIKDSVVPSRVLTVRSRSLMHALTELADFANKESLGSYGFVRLLGGPVPGGYSLTVELPIKANPADVTRLLEHDG